MRHRFPADFIRRTVWLNFRFSLKFRDVEEMMAQRGLDVSYETIRCRTIKFGPLIARRLMRRRWPPTPRWHLDEMVCLIDDESDNSSGSNRKPRPKDSSPPTRRSTTTSTPNVI